MNQKIDHLIFLTCSTSNLRSCATEWFSPSITLDVSEKITYNVSHWNLVFLKGFLESSKITTNTSHSHQRTPSYQALLWKLSTSKNIAKITNCFKELLSVSCFIDYHTEFVASLFCHYIFDEFQGLS